MKSERGSPKKKEKIRDRLGRSNHSHKSNHSSRRSDDDSDHDGVPPPPPDRRGPISGGEEAPRRQLSALLSNKAFSGSSFDAESRAAPPIADLFPASTVFFADLAGFTKWSDARRPTEVFGLLETIYGKTLSLLSLIHI